MKKYSILIIALILHQLTVMAQNKLAIKYSPYDCVTCNIFIFDLFERGYPIEIIAEEQFKNAEKGDLPELDRLRKLNATITFNDKIYQQYKKSNKSAIGILDTAYKMIIETTNHRDIDKLMIKYQLSASNSPTVVTNRIKTPTVSNNEKLIDEIYCISKAAIGYSIRQNLNNDIEYKNLLNKELSLLQRNKKVYNIELVKDSLNLKLFLDVLQDTITNNDFLANPNNYSSEITKLITVENYNSYSYSYSTYRLNIKTENNHETKEYSIIDAIVNIKDGKLHSVNYINTDSLKKANYYIKGRTTIVHNNKLYVLTGKNSDNNNLYITEFILKNKEYLPIQTVHYPMPEYLIESEIGDNLSGLYYSNDWVACPTYNYLYNLSTQEKITLPLDSLLFYENANFMKNPTIENLKFIITDMKFNMKNETFSVLYKHLDNTYVLQFKLSNVKKTKIQQLPTEIGSYKISKCLSLDGSTVYYLPPDELCINSLILDSLSE